RSSPRRRAAPRGPRLRADPRGELDAEGAGPRADRSDSTHDSRGRLGLARARGVDQAGNARSVGRDDRLRSHAGEELGLRELELAAELDGEAEGDVLLDDAVRVDALHAPRAEPVADAAHELLR